MSDTSRPAIDSLNKKGSPEIIKLLKLQESQLSAIGRVAVEFSLVEYFISTYICKLLSDDHGVVRLVLFKLQYPKLKDLLIRVFAYREHSADIRKKLADKLGTLETLHNKRNDFIHGLWHFNEKTEEFSCSVMKFDNETNSIQFDPSFYDLPSLKKLGIDISHAMSILNSFMRDWFKNHPNLHPRRSPLQAIFDE